MLLVFRNLFSQLINISKYAANRQFSDGGDGAISKMVPVAPIAEIRRLILECMLKMGTPEDKSIIFTDSLVEADYRGVYSHGIHSLGAFLRDIKNKICDPKPDPVINRESTSVAVVCGQNGLGSVVATFCMDLAVEKALDTGIGMVVANGSNNYGMGTSYVLRALNKGLIGLCFTNSSPLMVPTNAKDVALGSNPISMAAPGTKNDQMIIDFSTTSASYEKIQYYSRQGLKIPKEWAVKFDGTPECNPDLVAIDARLTPFGGDQNYKGFGLALLVEALSGLLADSQYGPNIHKWGNDLHRANIGHGFIAINPEKFAPKFASRLTDLLWYLRSMKPADPNETVLIPGDKERWHMMMVDEDGGVLYIKNQRDELNRIAQEFSIRPIQYTLISKSKKLRY